MSLFQKFTFLMKGEQKPKKKSFKWIISEDKVLLETEIQKLRKAAKKLKRYGIKTKKFRLIRGWFMVELGLYTGLRVDEMADLLVKDIFIDQQHASIFVRHGKGNKQRRVWINAEFKQVCSEFFRLREDFGISNDDEQFIFSSQKGKKVTKRTLQKQFKECASGADLPSHYSIHCLRHTYGTFLLKVSGNIKLVKEQLGHSSVKTTEVYIGLIEEDTKEALKRLYKKKKKSP